MDEKSSDIVIALIIGGVFVAVFMAVSALYYFSPVIGAKQYRCKDSVLWEKKAKGVFIKTDKQCIEVKE